MTLQTIICGVAISLAACAQRPSTIKPTKSSHPEPFADMHPSGSKQFSTDEAKAVRAAKAKLEAEQKKTVDARYRVTQTSIGYEVFVMFVGEHDEHQKPLFYPGGHCTVALTKDFKVANIHPGG